MEALLRALHAIVPVVWTASAMAYLFVFLREDDDAERWAPRLAWWAVALHLGEFAAEVALGATPLVVPGTLMSGMGLSAALVYLALERRIGRRTIGVFAVGTAAVLATAGAAVGDPMAAPEEGFPELSTSLHVGGAILGYGGLLLAALFGGLYLLQRGSLRSRRFGLFFERLPSLELLDQFSAGSLAAGTVFLTITIAFGHVVRRVAEPDAVYWDAKVVVTNALWLASLLVIVARRARRLQAPGAARLSLGLFALALCNLFVANVFSRFHGNL